MAALLLAGLAGSVAPGAETEAQDRPLTAQLQEVYRVGGYNAPAWAQFSDPLFRGTLPAGFDAAGNLHVLDRGASQVVVIDSRGELVRTIGRQGEGPGEFMQPYTLGVWRDGRFVVLDVVQMAFQTFGPDGDFDHFAKMGTGPVPTLVTMVKVDPQGDALIAQGQQSNPLESALVEAMTGVKPDKRVDDRGLERLDLRGDVITAQPVLQAWRIPREEDEQPGPEDLKNASRADLIRMSDAMAGKKRFLEPRLLWDILPDGTIAYCDSSAYAIKLASADGPVIDVLRRPIAAEAVTQGIRSAVIAEEIRKRFSPEYAAAGGESGERPIPAMLDVRRKEIEDGEFFTEVPVVPEGCAPPGTAGCGSSGAARSRGTKRGPSMSSGRTGNMWGRSRRAHRGCRRRSDPVGSSPSGTWTSWTCRPSW